MKDYSLYAEAGRQAGVRSDFIIQSSLYNNYSPYEAFGYTILFLFNVILITALVMMIANFMKKKLLGLLLNTVLMVLGAVLNFTYHPFGKWFPIGNLMLAHQNKSSYVIVPINHSLWYFAIVIGILLAVNFILVRTCNIEKDGER